MINTKKSPAHGKGRGVKKSNNTLSITHFQQAVKDTENETKGVIEGIVTMKLYYEAGKLLRHTVTTTKKYRESGTAHPSRERSVKAGKMCRHEEDLWIPPM